MLEYVLPAFLQSIMNTVYFIGGITPHVVFDKSLFSKFYGPENDKDEKLHFSKWGAAPGSLLLVCAQLIACMEFCMLFLHLCEFPPGSLISSHCPKTCG